MTVFKIHVIYIMVNIYTKKPYFKGRFFGGGML